MIELQMDGVLLAALRTCLPRLLRHPIDIYKSQSQTDTEGTVSVFSPSSLGVYTIDFLRLIPSKALYIMLSKLRANLIPKDAKLFTEIGVGMIGGLFSLFVVYPLDSLSIILSCGGFEEVKRRRLGSYYYGFLLSVIGVAVQRFCYYLTYNAANVYAKGHIERLGIVGYYSIALFSSLMVYPIDTIRKIQIINELSTTDLYPHIRQRGIRSLYKGFTYEILRMFASVASTLILIKLKPFLTQ